MPQIAYHATRSLQAVLDSGWVRPMRMPRVYLLTDAEDAIEYAKEFEYEAVIKVSYLPATVRFRWKASYALNGQILKLRPRAYCRVVGVVWRSNGNG